MYHLDNTSGVPEMPEPKEEQSISPRWFGESQEQGGISWPGADWFNTMQAEMLNLLKAAGIQPEKKVFDQLSQAVPVLGEKKIRQDLGSKQRGKGAGIVVTADDISLQTYIDNDSPRISSLINKGDDATEAFYIAAARAAESTGKFLIDVDCRISSVVIPGNTTLEIMPGITLSQLPGAGLKMLIAGGDNVLIKSDGTGKLDGQEALQGGTNYGFWAENVTNPRVEGVDIGHFKGFGAYFSQCVKPACVRSVVHDITGGYTETAGGIYFTNCIEPYSERNRVSDVGSNGIKFRADSLGMTLRGKSTGDHVYRAGYIGIANSKCANHVVENYHCEDCNDNGVDMNGCYDADFKNGTSVNCLDGAYVGENNLDLCNVVNHTSINCRRSGLGSMGAATNVSVLNLTADGCGSGVYCSGFVVFEISGGRIINSVKRAYLDNHDGQLKQSTGHGVDIQHSQSNAYNPRFHNITFKNNAGYDVAFTETGVIGALSVKSCAFLDSSGDGKFYYGTATLSNPDISGNTGYLTEVTQTYNIVADGTTKSFTLALPVTVLNTNYRIASVGTDWITSWRIDPTAKGTSFFSLEFGVAPTGSRNRQIDVTLVRLRPAA